MPPSLRLIAAVVPFPDPQAEELLQTAQQRRHSPTGDYVRGLPSPAALAFCLVSP